jgi:hypothetical protein
MHLRNQKISDKTYYIKALQLKRKIVKTINSPATHFGIREIQTIFKENKNRLYLWAKNRKIPPDNNKAEREIRPSVIARKVSFGSQSEKGAKTRSILMTVLHTAQKRLKSQSVREWFKNSLDEISINNSNPISLMPTIN